MSEVAEVVTDSARIRLAKKLLKAYRYFCYVFAGGCARRRTDRVGWWSTDRNDAERAEGFMVGASWIGRAVRFVNTCLPRNLAAYGRQKGYLDEGSCPGGAAPVMKMVIAMPGDRVSVSDKGIAVNGHLIADSLPQAKDHWGHPVRSMVQIGDSTVAEHQYWLLGMKYSELGFSILRPSVADGFPWDRHSSVH